MSLSSVDDLVAQVNDTRHETQALMAKIDEVVSTLNGSPSPHAQDSALTISNNGINTVRRQAFVVRSLIRGLGDTAKSSSTPHSVQNKLQKLRDNVNLMVDEFVESSAAGGGEVIDMPGLLRRVKSLASATDAGLKCLLDILQLSPLDPPSVSHPPPTIPKPPTSPSHSAAPLKSTPAPLPATTGPAPRLVSLTIAASY